MLRLQPPVQVEPTFNAFVKSIGGELVSELFPGSPAFRNADYYFRNENVVAELKCLEVDPSSNPKTQAKVQDLYESWRENGDKVPLVFGQAEISTNMLPEKNARELVDVFRKPINERIRDANRQIRETKEQLGCPNAVGVLLLVNESNFAFEHGALVHMLVNLMRQPGYKSINVLVYLTVNMLATAPWTDKPTLLWFPIGRPDAHIANPEFIDGLSDQWSRYLERVTGVPMEDNALDDVGLVHKMRHIK